MILHKTYDVNSVGHLTIGGIDSAELAKEFGTPSYFLDTDAVRDMCRMYKKAFAEYFGERSVPVYAGKALCYKGIYKLIAEEGLGADCVSPGELYTANAAGFPMDKVFFHGNNKTDADLELAISLGTGHIVVDGLDELSSLDRIAGEMGVKQHILLRITPGIDPHTHKKIVTGNVDSKFGMAIMTGQAFEFVKAALETKNLILDGFHCHVGSQIFDIEPFTEAADIMLAFVAKISAEYGYTAKMLNIGGGFGVRYTEDDPEIDYVKNIRDLGAEIDKMCALYGIEKPMILMEPGRSIVAAAGCTLYTCGTVKTVNGFRSYVSVDGGMPDNPRYTLYQSQYTILNASHADRTPDFECTIAGRCCESGDLLAEGISIAKPERGDIIATLVTGAYNYSMSSNYNRLPKPPIIEIACGEAKIAVKRETYEDIISHDI
ncbi:MAG: diaminopimelate decarboxylase [Ruminococcaceae bacterium]|nr:diaminopimelate decarboxylase [Oscillospiraceae bacterium]